MRRCFPGIRLALALALAVMFPVRPQTASAQPPALLQYWSTPSIPLGLDLDAAGRLYMADETHVYLRSFTQTGIPIANFGAGIGWEGYGVRVLADQSVIVADYYRCRLVRFAPNGAVLDDWPTGGLRALFLALDESENVYVTDDEGDVIRKFTRQGVLKAQWSTPHPAGVTFLDGKVYVAGMFDGMMRVYGRDGGLLSSFPTGRQWAEQLEHDAQGRLYVTDHRGHKLRCFQADGTLLWTLGPSVPSYPSAFADFFSVVVSPEGTLFAGDYTNRRVLVFGLGTTAATGTSWGTVKTRYR